MEEVLKKIHEVTVRVLDMVNNSNSLSEQATWSIQALLQIQGLSAGAIHILNSISEQKKED